MGEFLRILSEWIRELWPLRQIAAWERGGYLVCGHWWKEVGPGVWPVVPWFMDVIGVSMAEAIIGTHRQDITMSDGSVLSFQASATVKVSDVRRALMEVDEYKESAVELLAAVLSERLADVDAARLEPSGRKRLLTDLLRWLNEESEPYGLKYTHVRLTSFVRNARTYRLMGDDAAGMAW